jgi:hypothetical protein
MLGLNPRRNIIKQQHDGLLSKEGGYFKIYETLHLLVKKFIVHILSAPHNWGIHENYAHVIPSPMEHNQGVGPKEKGIECGSDAHISTLECKHSLLLILNWVSLSFYKVNKVALLKEKKENQEYESLHTPLVCMICFQLHFTLCGLIISIKLHLRPASHRGRRSRGGRFPPITLQEIKSSVSQPFTLEAKVQRLSLFKMLTWQYFFAKATDSRRKFGLEKIRNSNYG